MRRRLLAFLGAAAAAVITVLLAAQADPLASPGAGELQAANAGRAAQQTASPVTPAPSPRAATTPPAATGTTNATAVMTRYCVTCHNPRIKSGGLELDPAQLAGYGGE